MSPGSGLNEPAHGRRVSRDRRNSRLIAAGVLSEVLQNRHSLTASLERINAGFGDDRERAFVKQLCFGTLRWYYRLEFLLDGLMEKPLKPKDTDIRILALLGLYQLGYTRVKPHAAVAETVAAARRKQWARPLLNAVLRGYQREKSERDEQADLDPQARTAHPQWLLTEIQRCWPLQFDEICAQNNLQPPMVLRVNRLQVSRAAYLEQLQAAGIEASADLPAASAVKLSRAVGVAELPGFARGRVSVQDGAAQLAASLLEIRPGQRVLDACAAPGGKTVHLLETCPDPGELVAVDIDALRARRISENLARAGLEARVCVEDMTDPPVEWKQGRFDRILLDVPCSATGVIRRHPDIRILRKPSDLASLSEIQQVLLRVVWSCLKPGGVMLYSTCSLLEDENHLQIARFLAEQEDAVESPIDAEWGIRCSHGRQILPGEDGMDGFYYARLVKRS